MILHGILATLALLSLALTLWQWLAAWRFPLHRRIEPTPGPSERGEQTSGRGGRVPLLGGIRVGFTPAVTLLKPLKGCDEHTEACLRSWLAQDYAGEIQTLFAVGNADDPACALVKKLLAEFPQRDAQLVVCPERLGANAKVSQLAQLEPHAKHEVIIVSDADVGVPPDLLANVVAMLSADEPTPDPAQEGNCHCTLAGLLPSWAGSGVGSSAVSATVSPPQVGLVNCFYQLANPTTLPMRLEAIAVNVDFWSQVLQSASFRKLDFALGAVMATRRRQLTEIGGFLALVNCLADDYQLGNRIARHGYRIELCPVVVDCWSEPMGWGAIWKHQLRWARTIRVCQPMPYFFSIVANATLWPLLWLAVHPGLEVLELVQVFLAVRIISALYLRKWLTRSCQGSDWWLVPVKDLLQAAVWACAFAGSRIEWRGERYRLRRDGTLERK